MRVARRRSPPPLRQNRPRDLCPSWRVFLVMTLFVREQREVAICPGICNPNITHRRRDPSKFRSNPIKLANMSDTLLQSVYSSCTAIFTYLGISCLNV